MEPICPKDYAETVAVFRSQIVGALTCRDLARGELKAELVKLSQERYRPPGCTATRTYAVPTLQRWYYRYRQGGLEALRPKVRRDRGRARALTPDQRKLLLDIRREYPSASAELIVKTLVLDGRLDKGVVSAPTVRRLFAENGLDRVSMVQAGRSKRARLRWQVDQPNVLWHGDVCHGPSLMVDGKRVPLRIHALLDDASRYVIAIEAHATEREDDMLSMLVGAVRRHGKPSGLYLDNGSTYRGETLATACARMGVSLVHARPYDPQARGKMERYWRTLRQGCLDFIGHASSLHDVNVRLWAYVDQHYHSAPHAGLMGRSPEAVFTERRRPDTPVTEDEIAVAFTVRKRRRIRKDSTVSVGGIDFEVDGAFLAGRVVTVAHCALDTPPRPWIEHQQRRLELHPVDPIANAHRRRKDEPQPTGDVPFDPATALLDSAVGRKPTTDKETV